MTKITISPREHKNIHLYKNVYFTDVHFTFLLFPLSETESESFPDSLFVQVV